MCTHTHTHTNGSDSHSVQALLYIATDSNPEWLGDAPLHAIAHQIAHSHGPSGSNWHYLSSLGTSIAVTRTHARTHARTADLALTGVSSQPRRFARCASSTSTCSNSRQLYIRSYNNPTRRQQQHHHQQRRRRRRLESLLHYAPCLVVVSSCLWGSAAAHLAGLLARHSARIKFSHTDGVRERRRLAQVLQLGHARNDERR